jgi:hypothetical protein
MDTSQDFEDLLGLFHKHKVRYVIIGGLAFVFHAKPRYTKDMDLWLSPAEDNIQRANRALSEFGSPMLLNFGETDEIVQIDVAPSRIDLLVDVGCLSFDDVWEKRIERSYGKSVAYWIDLDNLIAIKSRINAPKHQEDARILREVKARRQAPER